MSTQQQDLFQSNFSVIEKRWPELASLVLAHSLGAYQVDVEGITLLIDNRQLTSNYDRDAEALIQAARIPANATTVNLFGLGLGDLPKLLLKRKVVRRLNVNVLNIEIFIHILNAIDHTDWLLDERVNVQYPTHLTSPQKPFAVSPLELDLADDTLVFLRDRLVLELDSDFIYLRHDKNHPTVKAQIAEGIELLKQDTDIKSEFNTIKGSVYLIAAGPTLNDHIERLKVNCHQNILIAVDAAVKTLLKHNIIPDYVVTVDHQADLLMEGVDLSNFSHTKLLHFPRGNREFVNKWPGPRYCAYSRGDLFDEVAKVYPRTKLFAAGSVLHTAVDLAVNLGAQKIIFLGADFGFPDSILYAEGQTFKANTLSHESPHWVFNGKGEKITTLLNYRGYLRDLESYIAKNTKVEFVNGSDRGAKIEGTRLINEDD